MAAYLRISVRTFDQRVRWGRPEHRIGRTPLFSKADLMTSVPKTKDDPEAPAASPFVPRLPPRRWIMARLAVTNDLLTELWRHPPFGTSVEDKNTLLDVQRILKAALVALCRRDEQGLARLAKAARQVLRDSASGKVTAAEKEYEPRPGGARIKGEASEDLFVFYGDVPDDRGVDWAPVPAHAGRFPVAMRAALQLQITYKFESEAFARRFVGSGWQDRQPGTAPEWPEESIMFKWARQINDASLVERTIPLFEQVPDMGFELSKRADPARARLRVALREWEFKLDGQSPGAEDFRKLLKDGLRALGANAGVVRNLFKALNDKQVPTKHRSEHLEFIDEITSMIEREKGRLPRA